MVAPCKFLGNRSWIRISASRIALGASAMLTTVNAPAKKSRGNAEKPFVGLFHATFPGPCCPSRSFPFVTACGGKAVLPPVADTVPLILAPISNTTTVDARGRFREIYCAVREDHGRSLPDDRPCDEALWKLAEEPAASGRPVELGKPQLNLRILVVPGLFNDCLDHDGLRVLRRPCPPGNLGFKTGRIPVEGRSGCARNARLIRDHLLSAALEPGEKAILVGYSKGTPDILEALVAYPEVRPRVAAVVSVAGAVGGSPLADELADFYQSLLMRLPAPHCPAGDGGGMESLRPRARHLWLSKNPLPEGIRFYSLANFAGREDISAILRPKYDHLARIDREMTAR